MARVTGLGAERLKGRQGRHHALKELYIALETTKYVGLMKVLAVAAPQNTVTPTGRSRLLYGELLVGRPLRRTSELRGSCRKDSILLTSSQDSNQQSQLSSSKGNKQNSQGNSLVFRMLIRQWTFLLNNRLRSHE